MRKKRQLFTEATEVEVDMVNEQEEVEIEEDWVEDIDFSEDMELELPEEELEEFTESEDEEVEQNHEEEDVLDEQSDEEQEDLEDFDFSDLEPSVTSPVNRIPDAGVLSIINSKNGKRVVISAGVIDKLNKPTTVQIGYLEGVMAISQELGSEYTPYTLKGNGAKKNIYCTELVQQITDYYGLDFNNRTSITFSEVVYQKLDGNIVALISVK